MLGFFDYDNRRVKQVFHDCVKAGLFVGGIAQGLYYYKSGYSGVSANIKNIFEGFILGSINESFSAYTSGVMWGFFGRCLIDNDLFVLGGATLVGVMGVYLGLERDSEPRP